MLKYNFKRLGGDRGKLFAVDVNGVLYLGRCSTNSSNINWIPIGDKNGKSLYERVPGSGGSVEVSEDEFKLARSWQIS